MKELIDIQNELKVPKGQYNNFGKYKYRSCEDILESVKPLCFKHGCMLTLTDNLVHVGDRYYIRATASIMNKEGVVIEADGWAREAEKRSGMDESQLTGTTSSYARKYALNALFCIDDTKDADALNNHAGYTQPSAASAEPAKAATPSVPSVSEEELRATYELMRPQIESAGTREELELIFTKSAPAMKKYKPYIDLFKARNDALKGK